MTKFLKKKAFPAITTAAPKIDREASIKSIDIGSIDAHCDLADLTTMQETVMVNPRKKMENTAKKKT